MMRRLCLPLTLAASLFLASQPQEGPQWLWGFAPADAAAGFVSAGAPMLAGRSAPAFAPGEVGGGLVINGPDDVLVAGADAGGALRGAPLVELTLSAWVAIERPQRWGGIISHLEDNGEAERGFLLGYEEDRFCFALATQGADDGDGKLTYLRGSEPFVPGRWHHVAATYDGETMRLYVDGALQVSGAEQSGAVLLDPGATFAVGGYRDVNEDYPMDGRLLAASLDARAWSAGEVAEVAALRADLTRRPPWTDLEFGFLVEPYLTWPKADAMSVLFEASYPAGAEVHYRRDDAPAQDALVHRSPPATLHECRLTDLAPDRKYFYRVVLEAEDGARHESPLLSFRTAASPDRAFTFCVIGDTQTNGDVAKRVSDLAWMHRPNLVVHAGDLVDTGSNKRDWTDVFFPSMQPLLGRVPIMPVLGNHEQDAAHYYRYMSLPEPERWYSFVYGDAEFFMIDGNRSLAEQSAQLEWLDGALGASVAKWRFAVLHQPPYTSDSNDYGDTLVETSTRGDLNVRNIVALLERHGVDMCFSGHVHDYERTFPIRGDRVVSYEDGGVIYVTAAGGGGPLEDFDPTNTWFGHKKARYHHLVYVAIHGDHLEFQAIDETGRLFDSFQCRKR